MSKTRIHYIFSGRVQGVGFRWRMQTAAQGYGVSGWVRNLYDGTVEAELEGELADISAVLRFLEQSYYISIDDIRSETIPTEGSGSFYVR